MLFVRCSADDPQVCLEALLVAQMVSKLTCQRLPEDVLTLDSVAGN